MKFVIKNLEDAKKQYLIDNISGYSLPLGAKLAYFVNDRDINLNELLIKHLDSTNIHYLEIAEKAEEHEIGHSWDGYHWLGIMYVLTNQSCCYVSDWNLVEQYLESTLPSDYHGVILLRGKELEIPALLEWPLDLMNNDSGSEEFIDCVWNYGTWGYCVSLENENIFIRYQLLEHKIKLDYS